MLVCKVSKQKKRTYNNKYNKLDKKIKCMQCLLFTVYIIKSPGEILYDYVPMQCERGEKKTTNRRDCFH